MALSRGISSRIISLALTGVMLSSLLSGCSENQVGDGMGDTPLSGTFADLLKPDVNREKRLLLDPNLVAADFPDTDVNPWSPPSIGEDFGGEGTDPDNPGGTGGDTPNGGGAGTGSTIGSAETWKRHVDAAKFVAPTVQVVNANVYGTYLNEYVFRPINALLKNHSDVYFRVFHIGYDQTTSTITYTDPINKDKVSTDTHCVPGPITNFSGCKNTTCSAVTGDAHAQYMVEWLGNLEVNQQLHKPENTRASFRNSIVNVVNDSSNNIDWSSSYESIVGTENAKILGTKVMTIWEKYKDRYPNLGNLGSALESNEWGAVPDLTLKYYKKATALGTVVLNGVTRNSSHTAKGGTMVSVIDAMFTPYNQFSTREFSGINRWGAQAYTSVDSNMQQTAFLATYVDGYHRTVIYLAAEEGKTLQEVLGTDYDQIMATLYAAKQPTDVDYFTGLLGRTENVFIPAGDDGKGEY